MDQLVIFYIMFSIFVYVDSVIYLLPILFTHLSRKVCQGGGSNFNSFFVVFVVTCFS